MSIWIPEELWYMIFKYMDTPSFYNTIEALYDIYPSLAEILMTTICYRTIRKHPKVRMMNYLYGNLDYFRKRNNYLIYRNLYTNHFFLEKERTFSIGELNKLELTENNYKQFIINRLERKGDSSNKKMFINLTKMPRANWYSDFELARHINFDYHNISIKLEDIFKHTCNPSHKEYLQLVRFRYRSY